ncbi:MAG: DUF1588 domain-containing protein [Halieaceae bacterium]|nr:DUF1588 domain-containing protein [Halieaceae bacterium]
MIRQLLIVTIACLLAACEQVSVNGPVGGATITVTDLRSGEVIMSGELSKDLQAVEDDPNFIAVDDLAYLRTLGQFQLFDLPVDPGRWYLVSLDGGFDYDADGDQLMDGDPSAVLGPVRGLLTGAQIKATAHLFGPLSEAAWRWVREHHTVLDDAELGVALDEFAASLVLDVWLPELETVNYDDLLAFNPLYHDTSLYKGSLPALDALENAIAAGASDAERLEIVNQMTELEVPVGAADAWFRESVSPEVSQASCIACHVSGGIAGNTDHVLVPTTDPDHLTTNTAMYAELVAQQGVDYVLAKATGVGHLPGAILTVDSAEYAALDIFLRLLDGENSGPVEAADLFEGFALASPEETLRRASLLLAGELPSEEALATVAAGDDDTLRYMIRLLMQGEGFHQFLIEGANDRLLTDKWIEDTPVDLFFEPYYPDLVNRAAQLGDSGDTSELFKLVYGTSFGIARQPLELIAHVVEQELPYTEILTADYTMVNPQLALAYRSDVSFADDNDVDQWQVATVEGYTRIDSSTSYEEADMIGAYVSGGLATDYPQAGVLNTPGWLARYPSTATNRNRARARWTWYHFLGFDIERSAPRTTDQEALADTDNPTLKNPACTVCHEVMDPVSGAYQNYGDFGFYKDNFLGIDSLPRQYKADRSLEEPYQFGETWYNDMREPGFDGLVYSNTESTLQDLAQTLAADYRFAQGTVKFWWPALMGEEVALAPGEETDTDYAQQLALFQSQSAAVDTFADSFVQGIAGGAPFNLKDLLVEMVMSPWFRVDRATDAASEDATLRSLGTGKLLTPEQLDRKTEAVTGYRWYETEQYGVEGSQLTNQYRLFYGGIDSDGVTRRATEMTSLMTTVVEAQPLQMGCVLVAIEFQLPSGSRQIFTEVERSQHEANAEAAVRAQLVRLHQRFLGETVAANHPEIDHALALFTETRAARIQNAYPAALDASDQESCPLQFFDTANWNLADPQHSLNSWVSLLIYYMTDYRYVYE